MRKHFLPLDGLGVRDLHFCGEDLFILAAAMMALDGETRIYRWLEAKRFLADNQAAERFDAVLVETAALPYGRGTNRAEATCNVPQTLSGSEPQWLVLYDAPCPDRKEGEQVVFADLVRREGDGVILPEA